MTPVTPVPAINGTNNNTSIKEELAWSQTDNNKDNHVFAQVTITFLLLKSEVLSDLDNWMKYQCYLYLQDIISENFSSPRDLCLHTNYKKNGMTTALPQPVIMQLQAFIAWMAELYINNNGDITDPDLSLLDKVDFNHYKIHSTLLPSPIAHTRLPSMVISSTSYSQVVLLNFKKENQERFICVSYIQE